jgi:hypothetical protein
MSPKVFGSFIGLRESVGKLNDYSWKEQDGFIFQGDLSSKMKYMDDEDKQVFMAISFD